MSLVIFDLDNTLIANDSDYLWGQFLVDNNIVDKTLYQQTNDKFYQDYQQGNLDIIEFLHFSLKPLAENTTEQLYQWRQQFVDSIIKPILLKPAQQLINSHQQKGDTIIVITATNRFITQPIVELYGIEHLLATTPTIKNGQFTGGFDEDVACFQEGKIIYLQNWLENRDENLKDSWFYSDSHNDLPLLKQVTHPIAVDPDEHLKTYAEQQHWQIISLR